MMPPQDPAAEVERLRAAVGKYFPIYDITVTYQAVTMMVSPQAGSVDESFDLLRQDLKAEGFIPIIRYQGGEHSITIIRRPPVRQSNQWINRGLLVATFITTALAGMVLWGDYSRAASIYTLENFLWGALLFSVPLMAILGVHELSHYYASKKHNVDATLPFFIPFIPPFGTMGAFISLRDPMPNRKALVEIGVAGPLGGLAVTLVVAAIGLYLTSLGEPIDGPMGEGGVLAIMIQPLYQMMALIFPIPENMALHPTAFAAWVGFFVTAINLLPAGQLDGGHIARGVLGDNAKYLSYATGGLLIVLSFVFYSGWLLFALLVMLLGLNHPAPLNDISTPGPRAKALGATALIVFAVTFVPTPIMTILPDHSFDMSLQGENNITAIQGEVVELQLTLDNKGNADSVFRLSLEDVPGMWGRGIYLSGGDPANATSQLDVHLDYESSVEVTAFLSINEASSGVWDIEVTAAGHGLEEGIGISITVG